MSASFAGPSGVNSNVGLFWRDGQAHFAVCFLRNLRRDEMPSSVGHLDDQRQRPKDDKGCNKKCTNSIGISRVLNPAHLNEDSDNQDCDRSQDICDDMENCTENVQIVLIFLLAIVVLAARMDDGMNEGHESVVFCVPPAGRSCTAGVRAIAVHARTRFVREVSTQIEASLLAGLALGPTSVRVWPGHAESVQALWQIAGAHVCFHACGGVSTIVAVGARRRAGILLVRSGRHVRKAPGSEVPITGHRRELNRHSCRSE
mmetsp:Transcript_7415/g.17624  ORF Transcript_7415/g.17624 Transcript_7415/m.17624 type:complete len:259 (+) Transcript_7415:49-825(+)